ncbi:MAG: hypothetical protein A2542_00475 [Parcubacteria group bacterium RIFOXYD2_FULL_52_8]|nr:MAG: hypothetical protein A2542_00475 [Parcubacteria group bacterium RIFOXYD2_FULL_52_8]
MNQELKVALLQIHPGNTPEENLVVAQRWVAEAAAADADIALLPEMWSIGYESPHSYGGEEKAWQQAALQEGDEMFARYQNLAQTCRIAIVFTFLERRENGYSNSAFLINRDGEVTLRYRKVHTVDKNWERSLVAGTEFPVATLSLKAGEVKIGLMICFDREFPEAARLLMLEGAEVILLPNAFGIEHNHIAQLQTRGYENMVGVAMTNYPQPKQNGHSLAFDGMNARGQAYNPLLVQADDTEGIWYATFDLTRLREYRAHGSQGDAYRRPSLYGKLVEDNPKPPFLRKEARR